MANTYDKYAGEIARRHFWLQEPLPAPQICQQSRSYNRVASSNCNATSGRYNTDDLLKGKDVSCRGVGGMETSVPDRTPLLLGWSSKQTDVLQRQSVNIIAGQSPSLFVPGKSVNTIIDTKIRSMLEKLKLDKSIIDGLESMSCGRVVNYLNYCFDSSDAKLIISG